MTRSRLLDRPGAGSYIAACVALTACRGHFALLVPEALAPVTPDSVDVWTAPNGPAQPVAVRFRWHYRDNEQSGGGRGTVRLAPPDTLRVDWAAVLHAKTGAAVVIGDSLRWAEPKEDYPSALPQAIQFVWTALGIVRPPLPDAVVSGLRDSTRAEWRYALAPDTLSFRLTPALHTLEAEWRRAGKLLARCYTLLGAAGLPQETRVDVPERSGRFELTYVAVDSSATFAPALWRVR